MRFVISLLSVTLVVHSALAIERGDSTAEARSELIPRHFLALVHASEVQQELKLTVAQVQGLESLFAQVDAKWFQSRNFPAAERNAIVEQTETLVRNWFMKNATDEQVRRLKQLESYSQGVRMLLRDDLAQQLDLSDSQRNELLRLAQESRRAEQELQKGLDAKSATDDLKANLQKAAAAEQAGYKKILNAQQLQKLSAILGDSFETSRLTRTFPMAPEFVSVEHWVNSRPLRLRELKGKVVLVHFYAFQCHNCHANFEHYRRWHRELRDKGVVVIGIQTPETSRERDPAAVKQAAAERDLEFPILVDLGSENWKTWGNTMWPTVYIVDKEGYIRYWWQGELNWNGATGDKTIEQLVDKLVLEK